ncbi:lytic polysaccharide monooxygenase [Paraherbaspirillum soli]|uniref:Lytic polysaccharide monooxygenase n=1 Tax=Paraherbaspirillum soli TaxID=631222 RepID=A0ABW0MHF0_9BURK
MKQSTPKQKKLLNTVAPVLVLTQLAAVAMSLAPNLASAHGSMVNPPSREYYCKTSDDPEGPRTAGCKAVIGKNGNGIIYDWMSNAQGSANGKHKEVVPDGLLCAGGKTARDGLDSIADWKRTTITPDANGVVELQYLQTAPHATEYFKNYISKDSYDGSRALRWDDLQLIGEVGEQPAETNTKMKVKIPAGMTGKRVIYNVWQRSDSHEAFYACSDVDVAGAVASNWKAMGPLQGGEVKAGMEITLRVFDKTRGSDLEKHTISVAASQMKAAEWIYALAQKVNNDSSRVKVGQLGSDGKVVPIKSATENSIFGSGKEYNFAIDQNVPGEGGGNGGGTEPPVNQPPVAKISGPSSANAAQNVALSAAGSSDADGDALTYTWTVPAGITATRNGAALNFTAPSLDKDTSFTFKVAANDGKASSSASHTVTVKAKAGDGGTPPSGTTKITGPDTLVAGTPAKLTATSGFKGGVSYKWTASKDVGGTPTTKRDFLIVPGLVDSTTTYTIGVVATSAEGETKGQTRAGEFKLTVTPKAPAGGGTAYQAGNTYAAGDVVTNNGNSYECKPFPNSGWCGQSPAHYEPGVGSNWTDAWIQK